MRPTGRAAFRTLAIGALFVVSASVDVQVRWRDNAAQVIDLFGWGDKDHDSGDKSGTRFWK